MVGMVIGMLGIIIMMQVFALAEGQRRTTTGVGDAQTNGAIALYGIQREIRESGYGISNYGLIGCDVLLPSTRSASAPPAVTLNPTAPVTINHPAIPAGDANTDTLLVVYGNTDGSPQGDQITVTNSTNYTVQTLIAFTKDDYVIALPAAPSTPCGLRLTKVSSVTTTVNVPASDAALMTNGATLYNLGNDPRIRAYAIRGGNLTVCNFMVNDCSNGGNVGNAAIWVPIASNIVSMRAEYGHDLLSAVSTSANPARSYVVSAPVGSNPYDQTTPTTACGWTRTLAVQLVLVARSEQRTGDLSGQIAPAWMGTASINLSNDPNWQNYRYKVFQTVVPLRNVAWMGLQASC